MTAYFGFVPSASLQANIEKALIRSKQTHSNEPMYILRDLVTLAITDEIIDALLINPISSMQQSDKRDSMEKLANFIKSTVHVLMKQLLNKDTDENVLKSIVFLSSSTNMKGSQLRVGVSLPDSLASQMHASFAAVKAGNGKETKPALLQQFKLFNDVILKHFMDDFSKTLELGMFKRKASSIAQSAITKAVHVAIDKIIPKFNQLELEVFSDHYGDTIYMSE
jgi:hypothetical protein